jgi:hypothetical protein
MIDKNKTLEHYKKQFAIKRGFKSWNQLRGSHRLQDAFRDLHEVAINIIEDLEAKLRVQK